MSLMNGLAEILRINQKYEEAERYFLKAQVENEKLLGMDHPNHARDLHFYAKLLLDTGRPEEVKEALQSAIAIFRKKLGDQHPHTIHTAFFLAFILRKSQSNEKDKVSLAELEEMYGSHVGMEENE